jgi:hypothetical protein
MHDTDNERELTELEEALRRLRPAPAGTDRDELMFRAGQAAAGRRSWLRLSATGLVAVLAALAGAEAMRLARPVSPERIAPIAAQEPVLRLVELSPLPAFGSEPTRAGASADYVELRDRILAEGLDALPALRPGSGALSDESADDVWRELGIQPPRAVIPWHNSPSKGNGTS